jgi:hypothetical protein
MGKDATQEETARAALAKKASDYEYEDINSFYQGY